MLRTFKNFFIYMQKQSPTGASRKRFLKICSKFWGEHPCRSAISIKLQNNLIEITLWHGCSPVNLLHIFRTSFLKNNSGGLILYMFIRKTSMPVKFINGLSDKINIWILIVLNLPSVRWWVKDFKISSLIVAAWNYNTNRNSM